MPSQLPSSLLHLVACRIAIVLSLLSTLPVCSSYTHSTRAFNSYRLTVSSGDPNYPSTQPAPKSHSYELGRSRNSALPPSLSNGISEDDKTRLEKAVSEGDFATIEIWREEEEEEEEDEKNGGGCEGGEERVIAKIGFTPNPGLLSDVIDEMMRGVFGIKGVASCNTAILKFITIPDRGHRGAGYSQNLLFLMEEVWKKCGGVDYGLLVVIGKDDKEGGLKRYWERNGWKIVDNRQYNNFFGIADGDAIMVRELDA